MAYSFLKPHHFKPFAAGFSASVILLSSDALLANDPLPDLARAMLDAAAETGEADDIDAVADALKAVFIGAEAAINQAAATYIADLKPQETPPREESDSRPSKTAPKDIELLNKENEVPPAQSETEPTPSKGVFSIAPWDGAITIGSTIASGNSDNIAAGLAIDVKRSSVFFTHNIKTGIDYASADGARTQQRWHADYQLDTTISDKTYAYARFAYEEDAFSGFDYRLFGGGGLGHYINQSEPFSWKLEGGPGYRFSPIDDNREIESEIALYTETEIDWLIRKGVLFEQSLNGTWTAPTSTITSLTALSTSLTDTLSTALSFHVRYETNPPADRVNVDKLFKASVKFGF